MRQTEAEWRSFFFFFLFFNLFCCLLDFQTSAAVSLCFCLSPFSVKATTASCTTTVIEFIVLIKLQTLELQYMLLRFFCVDLNCRYIRCQRNESDGK